MELQCLLLQQIKQSADEIELNLRICYDERIPYAYRRVALQRLFFKVRYIEELTKVLYGQFRLLEGVSGS